MRYLLNLVYLSILLLASPWILWTAWRKGKYREGFAAKLLGRVPRREAAEPCVWIHAVSVGEVNLIQTLLGPLREELPGYQFVISTTTKTGYELARKKHADLSVFYCPLDFSWAVAEAMRRIRPEMLLLTELELWPNLIAAARRHGAKVMIANGRLGEKSFRGYRRIRWFTSRLLRRIDQIAVQNPQYAERFLALGAPAERVTVTGSVKFDGARTDRDNPDTRRLAALAGIEPSDVVWLAGSTQSPEEALALEAYRALAQEFPQLRLTLVPRHPERFEEVAQLLEKSGLPWQRRSRLESSPASDRPAPRILLVDTVGELGAWWGTARIAFVGGSMGNRGGQNMIEPAAYGAAVSFGPKTHNFRDVVEALLQRDAAVVVADGAQMEAFVRRCLEDSAFAEQLGRRAAALVAEQLGASRRTAQLARQCLRG